MGRGGGRRRGPPGQLHDHLTWLQNAGLDAMCVHAYGNRAVLLGRKPG